MTLGITGGIGSGKSLVTEILNDTGNFDVLRTDDIAKEMMNSDPSLRKKLIAAFGTEIYGTDGKLNRPVYAGLIYSDPEKKKLSDEIVHPAVWRKVSELIRTGKQLYPERNMVIETALPGPDLKKICSRIWYISADRNIRIERLKKNRGYSGEYARSILDKQPGDSFYEKYADIEIKNNTTPEELRRKVLKQL